MEKFGRLIIVNLIIGWMHLVIFSACIFTTFGGIIYYIHDIIDNNKQIQNLVLVFVAGFFSLTVFGSLAYASHEFIRGLKTRDHTRMLMFRICIIMLFLLSCGYVGYTLINVYNRTIRFEDDDVTLRLIAVSILLIFDFIVWILVYIIYHKLRLEARQRRLEKHHRRQLNTVAGQLSILQPAYSDLPNETKKENEEIKSKEGIKIIVDEHIAEEVPCQKIDKFDIEKKAKTPEQLKNLKKFIENERAVTEKAFQKVHVERKQAEEVTNENLPSPPAGF